MATKKTRSKKPSKIGQSYYGVPEPKTDGEWKAFRKAWAELSKAENNLRNWKNDYEKSTKEKA